MGKPKYKKLFPQKIYRCDCLTDVIASCLANEIYSLVDICIKVNKTIREKMYCVTCGKNRQNAVFSCTDHMPLVIFAVETLQFSDTISLRDETKSYCPICVKKYLRETYHLFGHVNFKLNHKKS